MNSFFYKSLTGVAGNAWATSAHPTGIGVSFSPEGSLKRVGINAHPTQTGMVRTNFCA